MSIIEAGAWKLKAMVTLIRALDVSYSRNVGKIGGISAQRAIIIDLLARRKLVASPKSGHHQRAKSQRSQ